MAADPRRVKELFVAALDLSDPQARQVFLERECGADGDLRRRLEILLKAHDAPAPALDLPPETTTAAGAGPATGFSRGPAEEVGSLIADRYKLREPIGEGGMGTVWVADQIEPVRRQVALKLIKAGMDSKAVLARFGAERQALALMDHPNIARVLDAGTAPDGRPFFVMELVKGVPITRYCDENHLTPRQRLELFIPVCQAVQHAHQKGIIHRDLKPSNVLVARYDDRPVPKVIDFGVAKATGQQLTERTVYTSFGAVVGTVEYMSPEQASFNQLDVDTRSDIYTLGVLLYELLTGGPPFPHKELQQAGVLAMLQMIREQEPPRPSARLSTARGLPALAASRGMEPTRLTALVRGELDWIVMKCLEKDRNRRYETANALALEVQRYLADERVQACPPSALYRLRKFARRNKGVLLAATLTAAALVTAVVVLAISNVIIQAERELVRGERDQKALAVQEKEAALQDERAARAKATEQEELATAQKRIALEHERTTRRNLYVAHMNLAQAHWENANVNRVEELLDRYRRVGPGQEDLRGWEWYYQERLCQTCLRTLRGHGSSILSLAFSADGSRVATGSRDHVVTVWNVATGQALHTFRANNSPVQSMAFSPDGTCVATASQDKTVKLWDVASGKLLRTLQGKKGNTSLVLSLTFSADGTRLASAGPAATVWDLANGEELAVLPRAFSVAFSPDGTQLATTESTVMGGVAGSDFCITVWDVKGRRKVRTLPGHNARVTTVAFSPDGTRLASGGFEHELKVWDVANGRELRTLHGHKAWVTTVVFSPDGTRLASGSFDQTVKVWDAAGGQDLHTFRGHNASVDAVAFSRDGTRLASGGSDRTVKVWDVASDQEFRILQGTANVVTSLNFSPDGTRLASGSYRCLTVSEVASGRVLRTLPGGVECVAFSPDGTRVATGGSHDRTIKLWEVAGGKEPRTFQGPIRQVGSAVQINTLAFSPDGTLLASGSHDRAVKLWDVVSGRELRTLQGENMVWSVTFSPDGTRLACNDGPTISLWDVASGKRIGTLRGHQDQVVSVAFSSDGTRIASGGNDRTVKIWDGAGGKELRTLRGHRGEVRRVAFSPDGRRLASSSNDYTVKLWDVASGQELRTLRHESLVGPVAFSPDGMRLATGSEGKVRVWDATPLTTERRVEQEARARLDFLFGQRLPVAEVVTRLRDDPTISEAVRRQALDLVGHYAQPPQPP
jgi:WD40 repeat protein